MNIVSLFAGAGGLDLGFKKTGFNIIWANEYDKNIWLTYQANHANTILNKQNIMNILSSEIPNCDGIIGGPPCQSWSEAGTLQGIEDSRGKLFFEFIRIIKDKQPKFFLAENVSGMLFKRHSQALANIQQLLSSAGIIGYELSCQLLNASEYNVPQDRKRIIFVGIRKDLGFKYIFTHPNFKRCTLKDAIFDLRDTALPSFYNKDAKFIKSQIANHEYMIGNFSPIYMSRNRVRQWDEISFTIQAGARHIPIHPQAPKMEFVQKNVRRFVLGKENLYRRLSVRECARIQTFPDDFIFYYNNIVHGYKMVGNAVPINFAYFLANTIWQQLSANTKNTKNISKIL